MSFRARPGVLTSPFRLYATQTQPLWSPASCYYPTYDEPSRDGATVRAGGARRSPAALFRLTLRLSCVHRMDLGDVSSLVEQEPIYQTQ